MTQLPVSNSKVLLLLQGVDKRDEEVLVVEQSGEQSDALLHVRPCCVGGLMTKDDRRRIKHLLLSTGPP